MHASWGITRFHCPHGSLRVLIIIHEVTDLTRWNCTTFLALVPIPWALWANLGYAGEQPHVKSVHCSHHLYRGAMSLVVVGTGLEMIWLWLNQILTIIIELCLHTDLLDVLLHLVLVAVAAKSLERFCELLSLYPRLECMHSATTWLTWHTLMIVHDYRYRSDNLIWFVTGCELLGLSTVNGVLAGHHVAELALFVLLGPRYKWQNVWVAIWASPTRWVPNLVVILLDTDLLSWSVSMLVLLIIKHRSIIIQV